MFFVPWGWHIKNNVIIDWLQIPMVFVNQWRLPILFMISGMGTAFALSFRTGSQFIKERNARLGIPLIFGVLVIVPPQVYLERLSKGAFDGSYLDFYLSGAVFDGIYPSGNFSWHHLWFLPYLLVFSLMLAPVFLKMRNNPKSGFLEGWRNRLKKYPASLFLLIIPLYLYEAFLEPFFSITHNLVWDWFNFVSSMTLFFYGFFLISVKEEFWEAIDRLKRPSLFIGVICFTLLLTRWLVVEDTIVVHFIEAGLKVLNLWAWIITFFGYAALYLNKSSRSLSYCNQAVYPFYILHQTITVITGYYLMNLEWSFVLKFFLLVIGTFGVSWMIYEGLVKRLSFLGSLFGLKVLK
jgi:hypothetical protein